VILAKTIGLGGIGINPHNVGSTALLLHS